MIDLNKKVTQAQFAQLVGVTQPAVSGLIARGILKVGDTAGNWLLAYCGHLRETAAGRSQSGESSLNLNDERARLAAAQADKVEMENQLLRGEIVRVDTLEAVLSATGGKIKAQLEALPGALKRRLPSMTAAEVGYVRREVAKMLNTVAQMTLEDVEADENEAE